MSLHSISSMFHQFLRYGTLASISGEIQSLVISFLIPIPKGEKSRKHTALPPSTTIFLQQICVLSVGGERRLVIGLNEGWSEVRIPKIWKKDGSHYWKQDSVMGKCYIFCLYTFGPSSWKCTFLLTYKKLSSSKQIICFWCEDPALIMNSHRDSDPTQVVIIFL